MPIDLYYLGASPPCRVVTLTAKALGLELNLKVIDMQKGEHLTPEFLKMNPQHSLPTLDDNGYYLWESRAIATYLSEKYGKNDSLYPKDLQKRGVVDRLMYYDAATCYSAFAQYAYPPLFAGAPSDETKLEALKKSLTIVETCLGDNKYMAGDQLTLADFSYAASIGTFEIIELSLADWPKLSAWLNRMKELPYYKEANQDGIDMFKEFVKNKK